MCTALKVLLFVFMVSFEMKRIYGCGTLSTATREVIEGQPLYIEFMPSVGSSPTILILETGIPPKVTVKLFDRNLEGQKQKATETRDGSKYVYTISDVSVAHTGRYFVMCEENKFSNQLNINVLAAAQEFCGNLTVVQQNNSVGSTTQLVFISNKPTYNMEWFHWDDSKYQLLDKNIRSKYEETQSQNLQKFVFKIYKSYIKDAGLYKARCGNQIYSNTVQVNVVVLPPGVPRLSNLQNFTNCKDCIKALPDKEVVVTCKSESGSPPVTTSIFEDGVLVKTNISPGSVAELQYKFWATPEYDWAKITCNVSNDATKEPLSKSANVYLYQIPSKPVFSLPVAVEGSESQITCSATRGRPAPYIKFIYNNTFENFTNTKIFDEDTRTYNVTSTFHRTLYRWDNRKQLRCCYEHDLIRGRIGCDTLVTLNVKFLPDSVTLEEVSNHPLNNGYTKITLLCNTGESNPVSNITWGGMENIQSKNLSTEKEDGEHGGSHLSQVMSIRVGREQFGEEISCDVTNSDFPHLRMSSRYMINITYPPYITIIGDSNRKAAVGQMVQIICSVDSNPTANVTWWSKEARSVSQDVSTLKGAVLYFKSAQLGDSGIYFCTAENYRGNSTQSISLIVNDTKYSLRSDSLDVTGIVAGVLGAVIAIALLIFIIVLYRRRKFKNIKRSISSQQDEGFRTRLPENREDQVYSNTADPGNEPAEYASVIPKAQRQNATIVKNASKTDASKTEKDLVYAELDLDTPNTTSVFRRPVAEQTEYVELDFKNNA